jgi:hypothetical protein
MLLKKSRQLLSAMFVFIHEWLYSPLLGPGLFLNVVVFFTHTIGLLERVIRPSQGRYIQTWQHKHRINAQTSMSWVGFEPMIPAFERAKTVHALDRAATVIGRLVVLLYVNRKCTWPVTNFQPKNVKRGDQLEDLSADWYQNGFKVNAILKTPPMVSPPYREMEFQCSWELCRR